MRAVVQRVVEASVAAGGEEVGRIGARRRSSASSWHGLCVLLGVTHTDDAAVAARMADKLWHLRILDDDQGVMNRSLADAAGVDAVGAEVLVVSQFTLYGDTSRGRRPSWSAAAPPEHAEPLVDAVVTALRDKGAHVATGRFRAEMQVALVNDGPVTLVVDVDAPATGVSRTT